MTDLLQEILDSLPRKTVPVRSVIVGAYWTMVASRHCGLGATLTGPGPHSSNGQRIRAAGELHRMSANELAGLVVSENLIEASLGMAALNSLLEVDEAHAVEINAAELIARHGRDRNIAVVGHFPFVKRLQPLARAFWVLEQRPIEGDHPAEAASEILPQADVIAITGTSLINHTLGDLLSHCRADALVMLIGPSTPLSPLLFSHGVDVIAGCRVVDEAAARLTIEQGAVFQQVKGTRLISFARDSSLLNP